MGALATGLLALAGGYVAVMAFMFFFQRSLMYHPGRERGTPAEAGLADARDISVTTGDGLALTSWFLPPAGDGKTVVLFHGNAGSIAGRADKARDLAAMGLGVLLVEYRGFGGNPGRPTEAGLYGDARAHMTWLAENGHSPGDLVIYGESLGTGVAVQMALEQARAGASAAAVVLEAPFTSMAAAAQVHYPWLPASVLTRDRYDSLAKIGEIKAPLLVLHGSADRTVPQFMGRRLFDRASEPKHGFWPDGGGHVDLFDFDAAGAIRNFLASIQAGSC